MESLGSRIKSLRKKRKLTLEGLAANQMTKGMLSLIENDKAKPSMESLTYIAERLNVEVNELLEQVSMSELREQLKEAEDLFDKEDFKELKNHLHSIMDKDLPLSFETGRLYELYGRALFNLKEEGWKKFIDHAEKTFIQLKMFNEAAKLAIFPLLIHFENFEYENALEKLYQKKEYFEEIGAHLDVLKELDFGYYEVLSLLAVGKYEKASKRLKETIEFSKKNNVLYRIEELYRVAAFYAMMNGQEKDMGFYTDKLIILADFTDSIETKQNVYFIKAHFHNVYTGEYDKALEWINRFNELDDNKSIKLSYVEIGKSMYGLGKYEEALDNLLNFEIIDEWVHPFDLSMGYVTDAYIARCYFHLDNIDKAKEHVYRAKEKIDPLPDTPYKTFIYDTIKLIES
ncbi:XRE family transcriptional regulator [Halalkalibacillus sediminis]|uniref:XRE family transcriptional regulator n=1 Tax=Halalkalibacillus sediminis TaxID=2018042 RepID=A0A2I0QVN7_9BACI|nr:helix-turn-helix domain-containing protein [Halalkalibacillus sediminis]PKR78411.1 XRE family transcriptional regulator [Halalkalibacillus sediminis]